MTGCQSSCAAASSVSGTPDVNAAVGKIDADAVAVLEQADGAAFRRFRRDVADAGPGGAAAETAIGDEGHLVAQSHADDVAGGREHFLHARPAARPFVADDHHVARLDFAGENAFAGFLLALENYARPLEDKVRRRNSS